MLNPLFQTDEEDADKRHGIDPFLPPTASHRHAGRIEPLHKIQSQPNPAADLIRQKIDKLYAAEPSAKAEIREAQTDPTPSKHQKFMLALSQSGQSLAGIQIAWHKYYDDLPDHEKHEVWQEFYAHSGRASHYQRYVAQQPTAPQAEHLPVEESKPTATAKSGPSEAAPPPKTAHHGINPNTGGVVVSDHTMDYEAMREGPDREKRSGQTDRRSVADIKRQIAGRVSAGGQLKVRHHFQSLLFGLSMGVVAVVIMLFSFFNDYIIAPFIQPSRQASATPLIVGADNVAPTSAPEVIIPKINVEIPLNFSVNTTNESQIENALEDGVVHYPTTVLPGQMGNTAFFGHSSNNIFNPGHYKFAFALLHDVVPGDTFYLTYGGKVYAYQVFQKEIVEPNDVGVLNNVAGYTATATLITCDPPGTSLHRLVVWGEQVSPNPSANTAGTNTSTTIRPSMKLPDNGPSLWSRMTHALFGWL